MMTLATDSATTDAAHNYPELFRFAVDRAVQVSMVDLKTVDVRLPDTVRDRCLHVLGFALGLPDVWSQTRDLLLMLSPHLEIQGYRQGWMELLELAVAFAAAQNDLQAQAQIELYLGRLYEYTIQYDVASQRLETSYALALSIGDLKTAALALSRLAYLCVELSDLPKARRFAEESDGFLPRQDPTRIENLLILARIAVRLGEWDTAMAHYATSLELLGQRPDISLRARILRDIGIVYMSLRNYTNAISTMEEAIQLFSIIGDHFYQAATRMNLGIIYWYLRQFEQALVLYTQSESDVLKFGTATTIARLYNNRGLVLRDLNRYDEARDDFKTSIAWAKRSGDHLETANVLESLSGLYVRQGDMKTAVSVLHEALQELQKLPEMPRYLYSLILQRLAEAGVTENMTESIFGTGID